MQQDDFADRQRLALTQKFTSGMEYSPVVGAMGQLPSPVAAPPFASPWTPLPAGDSGMAPARGREAGFEMPGVAETREDLLSTSPEPGAVEVQTSVAPVPGAVVLPSAQADAAEMPASTQAATPATPGGMAPTLSTPPEPGAVSRAEREEINRRYGKGTATHLESIGALPGRARADVSAPPSPVVGPGAVVSEAPGASAGSATTSTAPPATAATPSPATAAASTSSVPNLPAWSMNVSSLPGTPGAGAWGTSAAVGTGASVPGASSPLPTLPPAKTAKVTATATKIDTPASVAPKEPFADFRRAADHVEDRYPHHSIGDLLGSFKNPFTSALGAFHGGDESSGQGDSELRNLLRELVNLQKEANHKLDTIAAKITGAAPLESAASPGDTENFGGTPKMPGGKKNIAGNFPAVTAAAMARVAARVLSRAV